MIFTIRVSDRAVVVPDARMETATLTDAGGWAWAAEVVDRKSNEQYADECLAAAKKNADAKLDWFEYTNFSDGTPVVRPEQLTTHRGNVINYINSSKGGFNYHRLKRILLYIVKHVRFQDDKKGV